MKKFAQVAAITLLTAIAMTSCKKDYTCSCVATANGISTTTDSPLGKLKKSDAEAACSAKSTTGAVTVTCTLK